MHAPIPFAGSVVGAVTNRARDGSEPRHDVSSLPTYGRGSRVGGAALQEGSPARRQPHIAQRCAANGLQVDRCGIRGHSHSGGPDFVNRAVVATGSRDEGCSGASGSQHSANDNVLSSGSHMVDFSAPLVRCFEVEDVLAASSSAYNVRSAPGYVASRMQELVSAECGAQTAHLPLRRKSFSQVRRELRKALAQSLAAKKFEAAFAKECALDARPRADEIERMVATFPAPIDWAAPAVKSDISASAWLEEHSLHCASCSASSLDTSCYFRHVSHWLTAGFDPPANSSLHQLLLRPSKRAYVDKWRAEQAGCEAAFEKWRLNCAGLMSQPTSTAPAAYFPLLPVVREKDRWRFTKDGTPYKVRLCLDLKNGGYNDSLSDWPFRYRGVDSIAENVKQSDWLATIDISRFYLRLPAGRKLRAHQWFQDPASYAANTHDNERMRSARMRFRQLNSVAFGLKSAPAYASVISAEFARILEAHGVSVAGCYVDDLLLRGRTKEECQRAIAIAERVASKLGIPLNDKTRGPCAPSEGITYLGLRIRTDDCTISVTDESRRYAVDRLAEVLHSKSLPADTLSSLCGILTWVCAAVDRGKPRRNVLYRTLAVMERRKQTVIKPRGELLRQLLWWYNVLRSDAVLSSSFWDAQPDTVLVCSDASGEDGWGACAMGLHIVGPWPDEWKQSRGPGVPHMLFKELVAPVITTMLLAPFLAGKIMCAALDNAGTAFTINKLSAGCPWSTTLLRSLVDCCHKHRLGLLAGHTHRTRNMHADALSHALPSNVWRQVERSAPEARHSRMEFPFAVADVATGKCFLATISVPKPACARDSRTDARGVVP